MAHNERFAGSMDLPPETEQPNVYPLSWHRETAKMEEIWTSAQRDQWDPLKLPWDTFDPSSYTWEQLSLIHI